MLTFVQIVGVKLPISIAPHFSHCQQPDRPYGRVFDITSACPISLFPQTIEMGRSCGRNLVHIGIWLGIDGVDPIQDSNGV